MTTELILYTAAGCDLCVEMEKALRMVLPRRGVVYHVVDIGNDAELRHRYGARIPVLVCNNREICELRLDTKALVERLSVGEC